MSKRRSQVGISTLVAGNEVRRVERDDRVLFVAIDAVALLTDPMHAEAHWEDLKRREPQLAKSVDVIDSRGADGMPAAIEVVDLAGLLRLIQSVPSPRAEKLKTWLAR